MRSKDHRLAKRATAPRDWMRGPLLRGPRIGLTSLMPLMPLMSLMLLILFMLLSAPSRAASERNVLVLYSLGAGTASAWQTLIHKGLTEELARQKAAYPAGLFEERFDAVRVGDQAAVAAMEPYLRAKYANIKLDTIITENYVAARFLSERPDLFPGVPRHYLNHGRIGWQPKDGAGYQVEADFGRAIGIMPRVLPQLKRVIVIGDSTERVQESLRQVREVAAGYANALAFEYWDKLSFDEMYRQAAMLQPGSAIFLLPAYHDSSGERRRPVEIERKLATVSRVPIFTNWEAMVTPGVAGGYVISGERIGRAIANIVLRREPDIAAIPGYVFDYGSAQRFHLQNIPPTAQWLNRPRGVVERYLWQIVAGVTLFLLQAILISALIVSLRSQRRTLCALHDERNQLEARVLERTMELRAANGKLEQLATTDPLTGIGNRRRMTEQINKELERSRRTLHPLSLLMVDIDHFKHVNDNHGHEAGDRAIVAVSRALAGGMRSVDMASRFGGEEFVLLMPETDIDVAGHAAERLRATVAALSIGGDNGERIALTISIGVAVSDPNGALDSASSLLSRADKALYRAKHEGRDRVVCS